MGLRRYRPGPGSASYSPFPPLPYESNPDLARPRDRDHRPQPCRSSGELDRRQLAERVGARYWGPGRFRAALRGAISDGVVRRTGRERYASTRATASTPG